MSKSYAPKLAVQLYSLRFFSDQFSEMAAAVADAGYDGVELVHTHGLTAQAMSQMLRDSGLAVSSSHIG